MPKQFFEWHKVNNRVKGYNGFSMAPRYTKQDGLPSKKQLDYIERLISDLKKHGADPTWMEQIVAGDYKRSAGAAYDLTSNLVWMRYQMGIDSGTDVTYVNLCKDKETGKKIKYRTKHRFAAPKGYEFIGQLSREVKILEAI